MSFATLFASVDSIANVGPKLRETLARLGCFRVIDLIYHLPTSLIERKLMLDLRQATPGKYITTKVMIEDIDHPLASKPYRKKKFNIFCRNNTGNITLVYFNFYPEYMLKNLKIGDERIISGRIERVGNNLMMPHPDYVVPVEKHETIPSFEAVYPLTYAITLRQLTKIIKEALLLLPNLDDWLDQELLIKKGWSSFKEALLRCHHPVDQESLSPTNKYRERLAYDELLANQLTLHIVRNKRSRASGQSINPPGELCKQLAAKLSFALTNSQNEAIKAIITDQASHTRMMRLLQGDVGSGKTVVALYAILNAIECHKQAAMMVPTEILATQHQAWIESMVNDIGVKVAVLTGKTKAKQRRTILDDIKNGNCDLIIGTHALFQEEVIFKDLGLVVIDEQHKFGVEQRQALCNKCDQADILVMSATPIPRTLTLALYGDMDISLLTDKPKERLPIITSVIPTAKLDSIIDSLHKLLASGEKVYWVCPLIEEQNNDEKDKSGFTKDLTAAIARYNKLNEIFPGKIGLVHGKMKPDEKEQIMSNFINGNLHILVSTTVIEVGVDVRDATVIIVEQAERFGLSQLHQLRGRVGRGNKQSYCILLYSYPLTTAAKERLRILRQSNDGFMIAEEDLRLRGAGEILGTRQSGVPEFKFVDVIVHHELFVMAREAARLIILSDPGLNSSKGQKLRNLISFFSKDQVILADNQHDVHKEFV